MLIKEINFNNEMDFLNYLCSWNSQLNGYIFRGHSNENYELLPTSLRQHKFRDILKLSIHSNWSQENLETAKNLVIAEKNILREFYRLSDLNGLNVPTSLDFRKSLSLEHDTVFRLSNDDFTIKWLPESLWEVAALTQHYGLPTRLLDWTYDPFVAAYFATKPSIYSKLDGHLTIWCLNKEKVGYLQNILFEDIPLHFITPHYSLNPNINAQKGLFTHYSFVINMNNNDVPDRTPLDELLKNNLRSNSIDAFDIFVKIKLPNKCAKNAFHLLHNFGYGSARIFPGYDGVAKQVCERSEMNNKLD